MKHIKFHLILNKVIIIGLWLLLLFNFHNLPSWLIYIPFGLDIVVRFYFYRAIQSAEKRKELVFIPHKRFRTNLFSKCFAIILAIGLFVFSFFVNLDKAALLGIAIPTYVLIAQLIFWNDFDGYLINAQGIKQFELFSSNYTWEEIEEIIINRATIDLKVNSKAYCTKTTEDSSRKLKLFLDKLGHAYL